MKKFWKFVIIILLLLLGFAAIGAIYLFFSPKANLFNICSINHDEVITSKFYSADEVSTVNITNYGFDLDIIPTNQNRVVAEMKVCTWGYSITEFSVCGINESLTEDVLTFDVLEPHGFAFSQGSIVKLYIPDDKYINLFINSEKSKVNLDSKLKLNDFKYQTNKGQIDLNSAEIKGNISLDLNNGQANLENANLSNNNLTIATKNGKLNASNKSFGVVNITSIGNGSIKVKDCNKINLNNNNSGGNIEANYVDSVNINSGNTNINIAKLNSVSYINLTKKGTLGIYEINGETELLTDSGNIDIFKTTAKTTLSSNSGNIEIQKANSEIKIVKANKNTSVKFLTKQDDESVDITKNKLIITQSNGNIYSNGLTHIEATLTNSATCNILLDDVIGSTNFINSQKGNITVKINKDAKYKLTTQSSSKDVHVNLMQLASYNGYSTKEETTTYVNQTELVHNNNAIKVKTTEGFINLTDNNY